MSRTVMIVIMACAILLRELHRFFSQELQPGLFPLDRTYAFPPDWYVTLFVWKLMDAVTFWFFWYRERRRDRFFSRFIMVLAAFYTMDFILFLLKHSQAGVMYGMGILTVLIYGTYIIKKR